MRSLPRGFEPLSRLDVLGAKVEVWEARLRYATEVNDRKLAGECRYALADLRAKIAEEERSSRGEA